MSWFVAWPALAGGDWLRGFEPPPARLVLQHPDDLHVTLAFFGEEREDRLGPVWDAITQIAPPGALFAHGLLSLPDPDHPSAFCWTFAPGSARSWLEEQMVLWRGPLLEIADQPPEERAVLPHLTACRPARNLSMERRRELGSWAAQVLPPSTPIWLGSPRVYRSVRQNDGRRYATWPMPDGTMDTSPSGR